MRQEFADKSGAVDVYRKHFLGTPHVIVYQAPKKSAVPSNRVGGVMVFPEDGAIHLALIPPQSSDNRGLVKFLESMDGIDIYTVDKTEMRLVENFRRVADISTNHRTNVLATELAHSDGFLEGVNKASQVIESHLDLIGVAVPDDDEVMCTETLSFLKAEGLITEQTFRIIGLAIAKIAAAPENKITVRSLKREIQPLLPSELVS